MEGSSVVDSKVEKVDQNVKSKNLQEWNIQEKGTK